MNNLPTLSYTIGEYVVNRIFNTFKDCFGGKDYVDIIVSPYYMTDFSSLPNKDRKMIEEYMDTVPKHLS